MALRDKLAERSAPFLGPGERIQAVMMSQTGPSPYLALLTYLIFFAVRRRIIVATDRSVLVLKAGFMGTSPTEVLQRLPRTTQIGPVSGLWAKVNLGGEKMYIHKRFHSDVARADQIAAATAAGAPPAPVPPTPQG